MARLPDYLAAILALHGAALAIVNLTPTPKDDEAVGAAGRFLAKGYRVIELFAGIIGPLAKR